MLRGRKVGEGGRGGGRKRDDERRGGRGLRATSLGPWRLCSIRRTLWGSCVFRQRFLPTPVTSEGLPVS